MRCKYCTDENSDPEDAAIGRNDVKYNCTIVDDDPHIESMDEMAAGTSRYYNVRITTAQLMK